MIAPMESSFDRTLTGLSVDLTAAGRTLAAFYRGPCQDDLQARRALAAAEAMERWLQAHGNPVARILERGREFIRLHPDADDREAYLWFVVVRSLGAIASAYALATDCPEGGGSIRGLRTVQGRVNRALMDALYACLTAWDGSTAAPLVSQACQEASQAVQEAMGDLMKPEPGGEAPEGEREALLMGIREVVDQSLRRTASNVLNLDLQSGA